MDSGGYSRARLKGRRIRCHPVYSSFYTSVLTILSAAWPSPEGLGLFLFLSPIVRAVFQSPVQVTKTRRLAGERKFGDTPLE
jgi:hypothetical protein